ncbi:MAG: nucleoside-diphosphate sugar epimerase/dehydratase [Thiolinea sp.]
MNRSQPQAAHRLSLPDQPALHDPQRSNLFFRLPRWQKRSLMILVDTGLLVVASWLAVAIHAETLQVFDTSSAGLLALAPFLGIPVFLLAGIYKKMVRFLGRSFIKSLFAASLFAAVLLFYTGQLLGIAEFSLQTTVVYNLLSFVLVGSSRYLVTLYNDYTVQRQQHSNILIYGADYSGRMLRNVLANSPKWRPVAFIDEDPTLRNTIVHGLKIYQPQQIRQLQDLYGVQEILLCSGELPEQRRETLTAQLENTGIRVRTIPFLIDILENPVVGTPQQQDIDINQLVGRHVVEPDQTLMATCIQGKHVLVTGAGGSIGSEICRQIVKMDAKVLVLFELSEFFLYKIEAELRGLLQTLNHEVHIIPALGNIQNQQRLEELLRQYEINTVYHAAAYKHVPMVEYNPLEGILNNVIGTRCVALASLACGVQHCILVSTDKAVRPTNVMGATKRMAEMILQSLAAEPGIQTQFSMVRFGNVLGSSGSVVPLFQQQISQGGPLTVTHPEITRFFMTISEASQLVIQAGAMANGGEVFLLDMGQPVKIYELARKMIQLSGLQEKTAEQPDGDIEIRFSGLRPGEKLYEELLIDNSAFATLHPRIFKAFEMFPTWMVLDDNLQRLQEACKKRDKASIDAILQRFVDGYTHQLQALPGYHPVTEQPFLQLLNDPASALATETTQQPAADTVTRVRSAVPTPAPAEITTEEARPYPVDTLVS